MRGNSSSKDKGKNLVNRVEAGDGPPVIEVVFSSSFMDKLDDSSVNGDGKASKLEGLLPYQHNLDKDKEGHQRP